MNFIFCLLPHLSLITIKLTNFFGKNLMNHEKKHSILKFIVHFARTQVLCWLEESWLRRRIIYYRNNKDENEFPHVSMWQLERPRSRSFTNKEKMRKDSLSWCITFFEMKWELSSVELRKIIFVKVFFLS